MKLFTDTGVRICRCGKRIDLEKDGYHQRRSTDEVACMDCGLPRRKK